MTLSGSADSVLRFWFRIPRWRHLILFAKLTKLRIAVLSALSGATGFVVFRRGFDAELPTAFAGVLILAMGACALNEFQDRDLDGQMKRTRNRPLPCGAVSPAAALALSLILVGTGLVVLGLCHNAAAAGIGLAAAVWYNGMYTYLKRVWAFAAIPGALVGAAPPVLGWVAAGGYLLDLHIGALAFFFFIWQMPHFWLLLLDSRDDYSRARLPTLTGVFSARQLAGCTFIWISATSVSSLLLPMYQLAKSPRAIVGLILLGGWLVAEATKLLRKRGENEVYSRLFHAINYYILLVMALLAIDPIL